MKKDENELILAWKLLDSGEYEKGLAIYLSLPWSEDKYNGMARVLTEMGHYTEAGKILIRGLEEYPCSSTLWVARGNLNLNLEDYLTALKWFERAIALAPWDNSTAYYGKALALENLGKLEEAVKILDTLIEQYPEDSLYIIEKAACTLKMGYPMEALKLYRHAMRLWRRSGEFHEGLALYTGICSACIDLNMNKEALEVAIEGLKELPGHPTLYYNAGRAYLGMGMFEEAKEFLREGLKKFPGDEDFMELLKEVEDDMDSPSPHGGKEGSIFAAILLALLIRRKLGLCPKVT